ncbi:hypothetical protein NZL82_01605 [Sphingomonas sanguinis]|uniref:hypothetical protein n=1 Tax=Sphingomonas sp. LC-1 TaxID=3110957 RepID=UPI0021BAFBC3|nr:hypothetical protein [Sphingomonas sp. LC-1]MCT8000567.1 hypothetical protein [Sphingomonas sp. LC-1]
MHIRRQLREAIVTTLDGIAGTRVLTTHRLEHAAELAAGGERVIMVYHVADLEPQRLNAAIQGARPTHRGFAFGVALIVNDTAAEDGVLDDVSVEVERVLLSDESPVRRIATRDVKLAGGEIDIFGGKHPAVALPYIFELVVPMVEGVPDRKG